jgi:hypothetical protein
VANRNGDRGISIYGAGSSVSARSASWRNANGSKPARVGRDVRTGGMVGRDG